MAHLNPFRYRGYMYDKETGLYYLGSRYYDPSVGRFLNSDDPSLVNATPGALSDKNLYAYCDNNPVMRVDDGGEFWHIIAGAALSGVVATISAIATGESAKEVLISGISGAVSGALTAAIPSLSFVIDTGMSVAESIVKGASTGKSAKEIAVDATISAGFSALTGSIGVGKISDPNTYKQLGKQINNVKIDRVAYSSATRNSIRKTAGKALNESTKVLKKSFKDLALDTVEYGCYSAMEYGTQKIGQAYIRRMWRSK